MGKRVLVVNSNIFASEIGNVLAKRDDCDFAVIWNFNHDKKAFGVNLRSEAGKTDVSLVAKKLGGGGHAAASGCSWTGTCIEDMFNTNWNLVPEIVFADLLVFLSIDTSIYTNIIPIAKMAIFVISPTTKLKAIGQALENK